MNKFANFLDKNYFYIIIFLILFAISGSIIFLRKKNDDELMKKIGDQYFSIVLSSNRGEYSPEQTLMLQKISKENNNYGSLASILLSNIYYKKEFFVDGDQELMQLTNDFQRDKVLRDYAVYSYGHALLSRLELEKFEGVLPKLSERSSVFYNNNLELIAVFYICMKDYKNALKVLDDNLSFVNDSATLKVRLEDIRTEVKSYLSE